MFLKNIVEAKQIEIAERKATKPLAELMKVIDHRTVYRNFAEAVRSQGPEIRLIAEVKKASPSKGLIRKDFDPLQIAKEYENSGQVNAISVLTEEKYFQGSLTYLKQIKEKTKLPILRKDFILDVYQIYEACAYGADTILLIASLLSGSELSYFLTVCQKLNLSALVEIHDQEDLAKAVGAKAQIIGINNRNLKTFQTDLEVTLELAPLLPEGTIIISESGITKHADLELLKSCNVSAVLVGEFLMRQNDIAAGLNALLLGKEKIDI